MATTFGRFAINSRLTDDQNVIFQTVPKVLLIACQPRGSSVMRFIISTSIANVIRFSAEGTQMFWLLGTVNTGINPAYMANANFAFTPRLIPATVSSGSRVNPIGERGIDAIDHQQRLTQPRLQRHS